MTAARCSSKGACSSEERSAPSSRHRGSGVRYARSFERNALRGKVTGVAGGLLVVSGLFLTRPARSHGSNDFARLETGAGLTLSGLVLGFVSSSFNRHAASDAARALWWNNSRYSRP
jgi:hypothetical protein